MDLLTNQSPFVWWVSDGEKYVAVEQNTIFANGQKATTRQKGKVTLFRAKVESFVSSCAGVHIIPSGGSTLQTLGLIGPNGETGIQWTAMVRRPDGFSGGAFHTQLVKRNMSYNTYPWPGVPNFPDDTEGEFWLDAIEQYLGVTGFPLLTGGGHPADPIRPVLFWDTPSLEAGLFSFYDRAEVQDDFHTYLRFQPDGDGSIPITIGRIDWGRHGKAEKINGVWSLTVSNYYGPTTDWSDRTFPKWLKVYHPSQ